MSDPHSTPTVVPNFESWHLMWVAMTGMHGVSFNRHYYEHLWAHYRIYHKRTLVATDLQNVISYVLKKIASKERRRESLKPMMLLDPERFEWDLTEAERKIRKPQIKGPRERILEQTGREWQEDNRPKTPKDVLERQAFFDRCKKEAGLI